MRSLFVAAIVVAVCAVAWSAAADARHRHKHRVASAHFGQASTGAAGAPGFWMSTFGPCEDLNVATLMWCDRKALNGRR